MSTRLKNMKAEKEIAIPTRDSLSLIKHEVLAYRGDNPTLLKLLSKAVDFETEAGNRNGSFPMEKLMGLIRALSVNSEELDVLVFLTMFQDQVDLAEHGIRTMVENNLGLVVHLVNKFLEHDNAYSREDRIQDGTAGLIKAAHRFDPDRNIKFSTYACWWIKQEARLGYMANSRTIRWPSNIYQAMGKGDKAFMTAMGKKGEVIFNATAGAPISLNEPLSQKVKDPLISIISSPNDVPIEDQVSNRQTAQIINESIDRVLTAKEAEVIRARFGIGHKKNHILADIGKILGVSPERVRHIQNNALNKLRKCIDMNMLQEQYA